MVCDSAPTSSSRATPAPRPRCAPTSTDADRRPRKGRVAVTCFASNVARVESDRAGRARGRAAMSCCRPRRCSAWSRRRASAATCSTSRHSSTEQRGRLPAARQGAVHLHRQPGRAARRAGQASPTASIRDLRAGGGRHGDLLLARHPRQRAVDRPPAERADARAASRSSPTASHIIHVSGHPARDELVRMYQWVRPQIAMPVHGEVRHLIEHAALARACQVPETIVAPNGTLVRLAPGPAEIIDHVPCRPAGARRRRAGAARRRRRCASGASFCGTARRRRPW